MALKLDARIAFRSPIIILVGGMLSDGRRVASVWFAVCGVQDDWDRFSDCLIASGQVRHGKYKSRFRRNS